ncbi:EamA family transporter [Siphonobacter sp. BAB-5385]|uniref:EamA family transporter n=1 Tax=Siphonobacter sp. BAB-5385 TaxID=1864822 RepID=UPI000B9E5438|nr:EamA family transporter [Siphonobacter sp. BAB-5385]OZI06980.1 EamA family transporter [Siphonobacter sp. BAB-5385]
MNRTSSLQIWSGLIYLYLAWGSTYLAIHYLIETVPPLMASGVRNFTAGLLMLAWAKATEPRVWPSSRAWLTSSIVGILLLGVGNGGVSIAVAWVPTGYAALIVAAVPIWLVLLQLLWLRQIPSPMVIGGVLTGVIGVGLLLDFDAFSLEGTSANFTWGILALLLATFCWSLGMVISQRAQLPYSAAYLSAMQMLGGGIATLLVSSAVGEFSKVNVAGFNHSTWQSFLYLLSVGSLGGFTVFSWLSQRTSPTLLATYNYVNPLVALLLGYVFVGEQLTFKVVVAAGIIILAVVLITVGQRMQKRAAAR